MYYGLPEAIARIIYPLQRWKRVGHIVNNRWQLELNPISNKHSNCQHLTKVKRSHFRVFVRLSFFFFFPDWIENEWTPRQCRTQVVADRPWASKRLRAFSTSFFGLREQCYMNNAKCHPDCATLSNCAGSAGIPECQMSTDKNPRQFIVIQLIVINK